MPLIYLTNSKLKDKTLPIEIGADLTYIIGKYRHLLSMYKGVGLSDNQIGGDRSMFVMCKSFCSNDIEVVINPKINYYSEDKEIMEEGCLSFPGMYKMVSRSTTIQVEYYNERWKKISRYYSGIEARIFQHEYDHLIGKCIL